MFGGYTDPTISDKGEQEALAVTQTLGCSLENGSQA